MTFFLGNDECGRHGGFLRGWAADEGTTLNQFINVAVAEKLAALRTARYFQDRAAGADLEAFDRLLAMAGDEPPRLEDEM